MRSAGLLRGLLLAVALAPRRTRRRSADPAAAGIRHRPGRRDRRRTAARGWTQKIGALKAKTGAEIAVLTVPSTEPLDDFTYAMRIADAWKVGRKGEDTGVLILVATKDRKLRILTGYGVEGILPDGLVGAIQDRDIVPAFRAGRIGEGLERGVATIAQRIMDGRQGMPPPSDVQGVEIPAAGDAVS